MNPQELLQSEINGINYMLKILRDDLHDARILNDIDTINDIEKDIAFWREAKAALLLKVTK